MAKEITKLATEVTSEGTNFHRVDTRGNYFLNGKCQNPKATIEGNEIGYNTPDLEYRELETDIAKNIWESIN